MRLTRLLISVVLLLALAGCATDAQATNEFTEAAESFTSAIENGDEAAADAAFIDVINLLIEDPELVTAEGESGADVLFDAGDRAYECSKIPPNSCEICTEEAVCGHTQTECLAMIVYLYPDDEHYAAAFDTLAPGDLGMEHVQRYIDQVMEKRDAATAQS